jgi:hypothetical protein
MAPVSAVLTVYLFTGRHEKAILRSRRRQLRDPLPVRRRRLRGLPARNRSHRRGLVLDHLRLLPRAGRARHVGDFHLGPRVAGEYGEAMAVRSVMLLFWDFAFNIYRFVN